MIRQIDVVFSMFLATVCAAPPPAKTEGARGEWLLLKSIVVAKVPGDLDLTLPSPIKKVEIEGETLSCFDKHGLLFRYSIRKLKDGRFEIYGNRLTRTGEGDFRSDSVLPTVFSIVSICESTMLLVMHADSDLVSPVANVVFLGDKVWILKKASFKSSRKEGHSESSKGAGLGTGDNS